MKKNKLFIILSLLLALFSVSCEDGKLDPIEGSRLYFKEAFDTKGIASTKIGIDDEIIEVPLTPAISHLLDSDVQVEISVDPSALEAYNEMYQVSYEIVPNEAFELPEVITIKAGKNVQNVKDVKNILIKPFKGDKLVQYALPLTVKSTSVDSNPITSKYIILLDKPIIQAIPVIKTLRKDGEEYDTYFKCEPYNGSTGRQGSWNLYLNDWTIEFWVSMSDFRVNNQAVIDAYEIYIRFGDVVTDKDQMQIKLLGSQIHTNHHFKKDEWTHVAFTYSASGGVLTIYVNGAKDVTLQTEGGSMPVIPYFHMRTSNYKDDCRLAQVRFWNITRTASQIESNRFYGLKPNKDMVAYWPMDEGEGSIFYDITENQHHAHAHKYTEGTVVWEDNVRFDGK